MKRGEEKKIIDVVDEINCQLSIIIIISFSFDLTLCAYHIMKSSTGKKLFFFIFMCQVIVIA